MDLKTAVELAKQHNNDGIAYLYEQTYQKNYYVALKYMTNEEAAQDVLQDAYIKAFSNIDKLENPEKFGSWMARIVATTALDELRKKKPTLFSDTENEEGQTIEETFEDDRVEVQPEVVMDQNETSRLVQEMMADLSDEQRVCITMFYMEEMSVKDIANTLEVSENTVKSRLNYGRQKIKDKVIALEKQGTKLYNLAPLPFFVWLIKAEMAKSSVAVPAYTAIASTATGVTAAGATATGATATTATVTTSGAAKVAAGLTAKHIIAGVATVAVVGGTATGIVIHENHKHEKEEQVVQEEVAEQEAEVQEQNEVTDELLEACGVVVCDNVVYYPSDYSYDGEDAVYKIDLSTQEKSIVLSNNEGVCYDKVALYGQDLYTVEYRPDRGIGDAGDGDYEEYEPSEDPNDDCTHIIVRYHLETNEREEIAKGYDILVAGHTLYFRGCSYQGESFHGEKYASVDLTSGECQVLDSVKVNSDLGFGDDYYVEPNMFFYQGQLYEQYNYIECVKFNDDFTLAERADGYKAFSVDGAPISLEDAGITYIRMQIGNDGSIISDQFAGNNIFYFKCVNDGWKYVDSGDDTYLIKDGQTIQLQ